MAGVRSKPIEAACDVGNIAHPSEKGCEMMKIKHDPVLVEETTRNAISIRKEIRGGNKGDFVNAAEIQLLEQLSDIVVRFVEIGGLVKVMIEIGNRTTHKDFRDAIPNILKWRDEVQEKQSDKIAAKLFHNIPKPTNPDEYLELLSYLQEHGSSYAKLAVRNNELIGGILTGISRYHKKKLSTEQLIELTSLTQQLNFLLSTLNIKGVDTEYALEQIEAGKPPFEKGYPVSRYKMIEVLRTWRKGKPHIRVKSALEKAKRSQEKKEADKV